MTRRVAALSCEAAPAEVDAGAALAIRCQLSYSAAEGPERLALLIKDEHGGVLARVEPDEPDLKNDATEEVSIIAPPAAGDYTWLAVCETGAPSGDWDEEASAPFSFVVKAHATRVVVWDTPPAIECGQAFGIKVGVKCTANCRAEGWALEISDESGTRLAEATLSGEIWKETDGLYYSEVDLVAPAAAGLYTWQAKVRAMGSSMPHASCTVAFSVRAVPKPECLLRIIAIDVESRSPVEGAKVVIHPYRAFTDSRGVAEVRVPKGEYRLFVSGKNYLPYRGDGKVDEDVTIKAELEVDAGLSDADIWS